MRLPLYRHPDTPCPAVDRAEAEVAFEGDLMRVIYRIEGNVEGLTVAPPEPAHRTDGLWRTTCFEAFLGPIPGEAYVEFNFAPSGRWAAYAFDRYRDEARRDLETPPPVIATRRETGLLAVEAVIAQPALVRSGAWRLGLTAVIEEATGAKSYWALAHPPGKPDFHHPDGFVLEFGLD
jgi:hypothetical protein